MSSGQLTIPSLNYGVEFHYLPSVVSIYLPLLSRELKKIVKFFPSVFDIQ